MHSPRIFLSPPDVGEVEEARALAAIRSGWVAPVGPNLIEFENTLAVSAQRKFAVAVSSGTAALHLGLLALGVKPGDVVICSTLTFVATANAITYVGGSPVFIDSEASTGNMSVDLLAESLDFFAARGQRVGAVVPVDFLGSVANYEEIVPLCEKFGVPVLADAAESVGAIRSGQPSGSFGKAAVFSFNGNKIMTTSGGGALLTDDAELERTARHLSTQAREKAWHYEHEVLGYNYRMSNVLAAIGSAQFTRLGSMIERRRRNREQYRGFFEHVPGVAVLGDSDFEDNCWLTAIVVDPSRAGFTSRELGDFLETRNIESRPLWKPMHMQPLYQKSKSFVNGIAEALFLNGLALPSGSAMDESDLERVVGAISDFLSSRN
jgi:dTDP-4-amino-4,6-dideoxygalactose transaminase